MKVLTVLGARPQFVKAAALSAEFSKYSEIEEIVVHTGQHFDANMSEDFFSELKIPTPKYHLNRSAEIPGSLSFGAMLDFVEGVIESERPDWVLIYGDTNSTLAAAIAAARSRHSVAHVEAGLRSYYPGQPEELNRTLADRISRVLFCPTEYSKECLQKEGYPFHVATPRGSALQEIRVVGDVMLDLFKTVAGDDRLSAEFKKHPFSEGGYVLCTVHRAENTDNRVRLESILRSLDRIAHDIDVVIPLHPRTRKCISRYSLDPLLRKLNVLPPISYLSLQALQRNSKMVLTDSGGVQKEAFFHGKPCITLRDETEWVETVSSGWNSVTGCREHDIVFCFHKFMGIDWSSKPIPKIFGDGGAARKIVERLIA